MDDNYYFKKNSSNNYYHARNSIVLFRGTSSSELNFVFIYFPSSSFEVLVIDLVKSLILLQSSSYFLIFSLLSLVGTSVKY